MKRSKTLKKLNQIKSDNKDLHGSICCCSLMRLHSQP